MTKILAQQCPSAAEDLILKASFGSGWCWGWAGFASGTPATHPSQWRWHYYHDARHGSRSACGRWTFEPETDHTPKAEPDLALAPHVCRVCRRILAQGAE